MSLRQVLTIYNAERQLSDDETALLNTLRKMTDAERSMFVDGLSDKPQKKSSKKAAGKAVTKGSGLCVECDYNEAYIGHHQKDLPHYHVFQPRAGKSKRASGMAQQLSSRRQQQASTNNDNNDDSGLCIVGIDSKGETCGESADHNVHHLSTHPDYHGFKAYTPPARSVAGTGNST